MIRREEPGATWVIHQAAHAYIAGRIANHWIGGGQMQPVPRDELFLAACCHDAGWVTVEQTPRVNAAGQPRTFTEMDLDEHFLIWQQSIDAVFLQNRYAGLLTSQHCTALYEMRLRAVPDPPEDRTRITDFLETQHAWERALIAALSEHPCYAAAVQPDRLADNLRLLQVWDYLSLLLCMGEVQEQPLADVPLAYGRRGTLQVAPGGARCMLLDPFPLAQPLTVWIDVRQVIGGPFADDAGLQRALAAAPYQPLVFEVRQP
ncbi:MAG: DUF3891 family protein [Anaerolineae bacterium]|nr:DUF3891 family protein [Anaerolineae bacterium]